MLRSRRQMVADLEAQGLRFRTFTIETNGPDCVADVEWNQRDLAHVAHIHGGFRFTPATVSEDSAVGLYLQKVLGLPVVMAVGYAQATPTTRLYHSSLGPLALIIESDLVEAPSGACERTTYSVGAPRWLRWLLPAAEQLLRRNFAQLQREDEPIRARRRQLRQWGYDFHRHGYLSSLDLTRENVIAPPLPAPEAAISLDDGCEWRIGRDDHVGLRVVRDDSQLMIFPRLCRHEGASLDGCPVRGGELRCPWHGRRIAPLVRMRLDQPGEARTAHHRLILDGNKLVCS
jgi:hypothetical protein